MRFISHIPYRVSVTLHSWIFHFIMKKKFHYQFLVIYKSFPSFTRNFLSYPFLANREIYKITENKSFYKYS